MNYDLLIADIGNSRIKFCDNETYSAIEYSEGFEKRVEHYIQSFALNKRIVYSSVNYKSELILLKLLSKLEIPFNKVDIYLSKQKMINLDFVSGAGTDRVLGLIGAWNKNINSFITIDFGSATTINYVLNSKFIGGSIMLGAENQLISLGNISTKLKFDKLSIQGSSFGNDTYAAVNSGIYLSTIGAIEKALEISSTLYDGELNKAIFITGGLADIFSPHLSKNSQIIYRPHLVIEGIKKLTE